MNRRFGVRVVPGTSQVAIPVLERSDVVGSSETDIVLDVEDLHPAPTLDEHLNDRVGVELVVHPPVPRVGVQWSVQ